MSKQKFSVRADNGLYGAKTDENQDLIFNLHRRHLIFHASSGVDEFSAPVARILGRPVLKVTPCQ